MIAGGVVSDAARATGVGKAKAFVLAGALLTPGGPGFGPLADIIDEHGVDACREILRRLIAADDAGRLIQASAKVEALA